MLLPQPALDALHRHRAEAVGALAILCLADALRALARLVRALCAYFLRPGVDPRAYTGPGGWAVVTGSTDGMGKALAAELAQKGGCGVQHIAAGCWAAPLETPAGAPTPVHVTPSHITPCPAAAQASTSSSSPAPSPAWTSARRSCGRRTACRPAP